MDWFDLWCRTQLHGWLRDAGMSVPANEYMVLLAIFKAGIMTAMGSMDELEERLMDDFTEVM